MSNIKPYEYQEPIIGKVVEALAKTRRALLVMATGTGKTITAAFAIKRLLKSRRERVLFLCHSEDILKHAASEFQKVFGPKETYGFFTGNDKEGHDTARFVFATLQTMDIYRLAFDPKEFALVVVDESHHSQAHTFKRAIKRFRPAKGRLGLTATPDRMDRKDIRELFGAEVATLTLAKAIADKFLTKVEYRIMTIGALADGSIKRLLKEVQEGRRLTVSQLNATVFIDRMDDEVVTAIEEVEGSTIIFCENTKHADRIAGRLNEAATYHSGNKDYVNEWAYDAIKEGEIERLATVNKFNEGVDMPDARVVVFLRATESPTIYWQQLGRGLRRSPGKEKVIILDFVGNAERIAMIQELMEEIKKHQPGEGEPGEGEICGIPLERESIVLSGDGYDFTATAEVVDIMELLARTKVDFYPYQEASERAQQLGIKSSAEYGRRYSQDPRLPSHPRTIYTSNGWISWPEFLGTGFYSYKDASERAQELRVRTVGEYWAVCGRDRRLPKRPDHSYASKGWKSWPVFLGTLVKYSYKEAVRRVRKLHIKSSAQYISRYREDRRLPSSPHRFYAGKGWISWSAFTGKRVRV